MQQMLIATHDLKFNTFAVQFDSADLEVDTNCGNEGRCPCIITETQQKTRLANT